MSRQRILPATVLAALVLAAQAVAQDARVPAPVPPPPGIDAPGVKALPAPTHTAPAPAARATAAPAPVGQETDALGEPPPTVDVRSIQGNKVEEYRINGRLYMIHVIPRHGIPQTYLADPEGHLYRQAGQPPVSPVFYTIYTWDKAPKTVKDDSDQ